MYKIKSKSLKYSGTNITHIYHENNYNHNDYVLKMLKIIFNDKLIYNDYSHTIVNLF